MSQTPSCPAMPSPRPSLAVYLQVSLILALTVAYLVWASGSSDRELAPRALVPPFCAMLVLTALVWLSMVFGRNIAVALGKASVRYYHSYVHDVPSEVVERPARAFNNLMQMPPVFYAVCLLMIALNRVDEAQLRIAWAFVALRTLHALVLIAWNYVPYRFAVHAASSITLFTLAFRAAVQCWP